MKLNYRHIIPNTRKQGYVSIGDIGNTRFWASFEWKPYTNSAHISLGKTYNGTKRGIVITLWRFVFIAHERDLNAFN